MDHLVVDVADGLSGSHRLATPIADFVRIVNGLYALVVSAGLARFDPASTSSVEEVMLKADEEMYRNKRGALERP